MASSLPLSYEYSVVLKNGARLLLPSVHPRHLSPAERRCDSCSTIWGEKPNDEDCIEYPFVMIPCQHIVGSACLGLGLKEDKPACPVCNTRIQLGRQTEAPLHQADTSDDGSQSVADRNRSEVDSDMEAISQADDVSPDSDPAQENNAGIPSVAAGADSSNVRVSPILPASHSPLDRVFGNAFTPINGPAQNVAFKEGSSETMATASNIRKVPTPVIQITPSSRSQTEETEIAAPSSNPSAPSGPTRTLTRLDPEWYDNMVPPKAKAANHPHSKPRPISDFVWTMASVQGALDVCNIQRNMALDMPYLKTMVAINNYTKGIHGREPTPWELVTALQDLYGYGR